MKDKIVLVEKEELAIMLEEAVRKILSEKKQLDSLATDNTLLLSIQDAATYLKLSVSTLYSFTSKRMIPFLKKGKRLYFKRIDLNNWLEAGKKKTVAEMTREIASTGKLKLQ